MFKRLAEFRLVQSRRTASGPRDAIIHSNDNLPGFRRPAATGKRRPPSPALACHWFDRNGRLECQWQVERGDAPIDGFDEQDHCTTGGVSGRIVDPIARPARRMSAGSPWTSERCSHASWFSERADGHSHTCFGCGRVALLHRSPCRDLSGIAMTTGGLITVGAALLGCRPPLDK
jgi:hypothetical protein